MRKEGEQTIKSVIDRLLDAYKLRAKLDEVEVVRCWNTLMGPPIVKYTEKIFVRNKCLYIKITSAPLKQELFYAREKILLRMNEALGGDGEPLENVVII